MIKMPILQIHGCFPEEYGAGEMTLDIMEQACAKGLYIKSYNTNQMYSAAQKLGSIAIFEKMKNMTNEKKNLKLLYLGWLTIDIEL